MSKAPKVGTPVEQPKNEFPPTVFDNGDGTREEVAPAPAPEPSMKTEAEQVAEAGLEATEAAAPLEDKREVDAAAEREFVDYVNGDLKEIAEQFGYDLKITKRSAVSVGPIMLYDPASREGRVYSSRAEAPSYFLTGEQMQEVWASEREAAAE